jgi:hypothetical protein
MRTSGMLVIGAVLVLAAGGQANANGVYSDALTVYSPTGTIFAQVGVTEAQEVAGQIYFIDIDGLAAIVQANSPTELLEPGTGYISDIFGCGLGTAEQFYYLYFKSDSEDPQSLSDTVAGAIQLTETPGAIYDATRYLAANYVAAGYTATFVSDQDPDPTSVPEPVTVAGLTLGIGALARYVRGRK